jgi:hypothetical protein
MSIVSKRSLFRPTVALLATLLTAGTASADTTALAIDPEADLLPGRAEATVIVDVTCTLNDNATLTVHVFQSLGRLINVGIGTHAFTCSGNPESFPITVSAVPGLKFQSGPATAIVRSATGAGASIDSTYDAGAKIKLK